MTNTTFAMNSLKLTQNTVGQPSQASRPFGCDGESEDSRVNSLQIHYIEQARLPEFLQARKNSIAGLVCYGEPLKLQDQFRNQFPSPIVRLKQFNQEPLVEVWIGTAPFTYIHNHGCCFAFNGHFLFGVVQVTEAEDLPLENLTYSTYQSMLNQLAALGYPHLLRIWNYFSGINREHDGLEQYKRFCIGRHRAFSNIGENFYAILPAATAVGTQSGSLQIHFLAGKLPGTHIENPRQLSAYHYPPIYGPKSPSFARATLATIEREQKLFIAGTSSIVGHTTQHQGKVEDQTKETLCNIEALIHYAKSNTQTGAHHPEKPNLVKVHMRHQEHFPKIKEIITNSLGKSVSALYLQGDICRGDLLVEIEGIFSVS